MNILLTGSEGFIGSYVKRILLAQGHDLICVDRMEPRVHGYDATPRLGTLRRLSGLLLPEEIEGVEVVIHLGAQVGVADSMLDHRRYIYENTHDTACLMQTLRAVRPRRIVVASSMSIYGDPGTHIPIHEDWAPKPASIYGLTKFDQERLVLMCAPLMGATGVALRFFNVYGPGQALTNPYTGVLANFAKRILEGKAPIVYEDGLQTRDFVFVEDVAQAVVAAATSDHMNGVYNVSTGRASTILDVATKMVGALGGDVAPHVNHEVREGDIRHCVGDTTRLRHAFPAWAPMSFDEGLDIYAQHLRGRKEVA